MSTKSSLNVLLINPPRHHELIGCNPHIIEKHRGYNPPLSLLHLGAYIKGNSEHKVEIIDCQPPEWSYNELVQILANKEADIVGITTMTFTLIDCQMTMEVVKKALPNAKIILGGSHVHLYPRETLDLEGCDYIIQGEGEKPFLAFLHNFPNEEKLKKIDGLAFIGKDGQFYENGVASKTTDLDELGFPDRTMLNINNYNSLLGKNDIITTMFTSRGCPYKCTFCDRPFSPTISGFRWRSAAHVADEFEACAALGIKEIIIYDDTFTVRKDRVLELCEEIQRRNIKLRWNVRAHVNTINKELLLAMKAAGCDRLHYGVEVGNDRMMKVIKKNANVARVREVVGLTKKLGFEVLCYFIVGQQTESPKDIEDTINLACSLDANYVHFAVFCPYPGTEIYQQGLNSGIIKEDVWKNYAMDPQPGFELPVWEEKFTRYELQAMLIDAYKRFYLRPGYMIKSGLSIRNWGEFKRKALAGLSVVGMKPTVERGKISAAVRKIVPNASYDVHSSV
jgi:anaerobic magnesium-protoporphyrin IX monomethyl ester cyclase